MTSLASMPPETRLLKTRRLLGVAGTLTALGIALSAADTEAAGKWITLLGLILLLYGLHRFGRSGPDEPLVFERKKKKKKKRASAD